MSLPGFLWRYARRHVAWMAAGAAAVVLFALATTSILYLSGPLFTEVLGIAAPTAVDGLARSGDAGGAAAEGASWLLRRLDAAYRALRERFVDEPGDVAVFVPLLFLVAFLLRSSADFMAGYAFQHVGFGTTTDIRNDLYARLLAQSNRFHARHSSGELVSRIVGDVAQMQSAVSNRLLDLLQYSLLLVLQLALLLSINAKLAAVCLVGMPLVLYPLVRFGRSMRKASVRGQERLADLAHLVSEGVRGHRIVKAFGAEAYETRRFAEATQRHLRVNLRAQTLSNLSGPVVEAFGMFGAAGLLAYAGRQIHAGELRSEDLIRFLATLFTMYDPIRRLNRVNLILQQALASTKRVRDVLAEPMDIRDPEHPVPLDGFRQAIRFEGLSFAYERNLVLRDVDLEVPRGQVVALVGASGAGKSTLVNLLPRFFDPTAGRVSIDGIDVRQVRLSDLRRLVALVGQETVLFDDTARRNIAYGEPDAPLERVMAAARAGFAAEFIESLPQGYDTVLGEGGLKLSGGQRQRLAIARAIFKDAPILILDEATSQLDSESEALVQEALANLMRGRTTLVIAHRLATVIGADRIVVLDAGRIVDQGRHAELLTRDGVYRRLYDLQFRDDEPPSSPSNGAVESAG